MTKALPQVIGNCGQAVYTLPNVRYHVSTEQILRQHNSLLRSTKSITLQIQPSELLVVLRKTAQTTNEIDTQRLLLSCFEPITISWTRLPRSSIWC